MKEPKITIIVPYGPGYPYDVVLDSIKRADYPKDKIEVIVVEGRQPAKQRNEAIKKSTGDFIFFFDDDVILKKDIIKKMLKFYDDEKVAIVGGPNLTPPSDSFLQKYFGYVMGSFFGAAQMSNRYAPKGDVREATEKDLILCNLSGRTSVLKKNLFNETLWPNEENEVFNRLRREGCILMYDPKSVVYHSRRPTIKKFVKQNFGYGRGRLEQIFIQPSCFEPLFLFPTFFSFYVIGLVLITLFNIFPPLWTVILAVPLMLYGFADILASFHVSFKNKDVLSFLVVPFLFPLVHIPYGLGVVYGYIKNVFSEKKFDLNVKLKKIKL